MATFVFFCLFICLVDATWSPNRPMRQCEDYWTWGADDERGANNYQSSETTLDAIRQIREGKVYDLSHPLESGMPLFPGDSYQFLIPDSPAGRESGSNQIAFNAEFLATGIGHVGTHYDALAHVLTVEESDGTRKETYYNGFDGKDIAGPFGFQKLGIEKLQPFFTRGILLDIAKHRGVDVLAQDAVIRLEELFAVIEAQGLNRGDITQGSIVITHTGQNKIRMTEKERFVSSWPGLDIESTEWLAKRGVSVIGTDALAPDVTPNPDYPDAYIPGHQFAIVCAGIGYLEQVNSQHLADDEVYKFAWIYNPVKFKGGTGSPGAGIAVV